MKSINIISSLVCSLFVLSGQQANANTYSNSTANGLNYVQADVVKLAKQLPKVEAKEQVKIVVKEEPKKEVKEEPKKEVKEEPKKEVKEEPKNEVKEEPKKEVKEESKNEVKEEPKNEVKNEVKDEVKDEVTKDVKNDKDEAKNDDKDNSEDGTNPLSFENLVSNDHNHDNHCKSKKGNECNVGDDDDEDSHHNGGHDEDDYEHEISPVPIPGAIWLFGTALMGFISMSSRRKV